MNIIRVAITEEHAAHATAVAKAQYARAVRERRKDWSPSDDPEFITTLGCLCEMCVFVWLGRAAEYQDTPYVNGPPPDLPGTDIGIRGTDWPMGHLSIKDKDPDEKPFIMVIQHSLLRYSLRGWALAREAKRPEWLKPQPDHKGTRTKAVWHMPQTALHDMQELIVRYKLMPTQAGLFAPPPEDTGPRLMDPDFEFRRERHGR